MYAVEELLRQAFTVSFLLLVPVLAAGVGAGIVMSLFLALFGVKEAGTVFAARLLGVGLAIAMMGTHWWHALGTLVQESWR